MPCRVRPGAGIRYGIACRVRTRAPCSALVPALPQRMQRQQQQSFRSQPGPGSLVPSALHAYMLHIQTKTKTSVRGRLAVALMRRTALWPASAVRFKCHNLRVNHLAFSPHPGATQHLPSPHMQGRGRRGQLGRCGMCSRAEVTVRGIGSSRHRQSRGRRLRSEGSVALVADNGGAAGSHPLC